MKSFGSSGKIPSNYIQNDWQKVDIKGTQLII